MKVNITSRFGQMESFRSHPHTGIDFNFSNGSVLRSIQDGVIQKIVDYGNLNSGKTVFIKWEDGKTAIYGHLSKFADIKEGEKVNVGDIIGYSGNSGHTVGANGGYHLHFGLKNINGEYIDPSPYIDHIQNMNNLQKLYALTDTTSQHVLTFTDLITQQQDIYKSIFESLKFQFLHLLSIDYSVFIQYIQNLFQLFS